MAAPVHVHGRILIGCIPGRETDLHRCFAGMDAHVCFLNTQGLSQRIYVTIDRTAYTCCFHQHHACYVATYIDFRLHHICSINCVLSMVT